MSGEAAFFSDNAAPVHPRVLEAIAAANAPDRAYDADALSQRLDAAFSDLFETHVTALWVATGTAANSIALASFVRPWEGVLCHREAHIEADEAGAPDFYMAGGKLMLLDGAGAKIGAEAVNARIAAIRPDVHRVQPAAISITNATEYGLAWRAHEIAPLGECARRHGLKLHMDGARFANALAFTGEHPADVTWRAGVDALSFGFVKNGGMNAEALLFFGDAPRAIAEKLRKRGGHLQSKGRFLAAQLLAMLDDDLWLDNARAANAGAARLAAAAGARLLYPVEANEVFLRVTASEAALLRSSGFDFYDWGEGAARLVTGWHQDAAAVTALAEALSCL